MSTSTLSRFGGPTYRQVHRIAHRASKLGNTLEISKSLIYTRRDIQSIASVEIGDGCVRFLDGDWEVLIPFGDTDIARPPHGQDGRTMLAKMFPDFDEFTIGEVGTLLDISRKTLLRLARDGRMPAHKRGHAWFIARGALVEWLLSRRRPARWEIKAEAVR